MRLEVLLVRIVVSLFVSWLLLRLFFEGGGPVAIVGFAGLMVGAAYIVEQMKKDRADEQT
jgi:hypothetical protein